MPIPPTVTDSLVKLQAWMKTNAADVVFQPPANPTVLDNFSEKSGLTLPKDLQELLLAANGETRKSAGAIGNWRIMSITEIQAAWGWLSQLAVKGVFAEGTPEPSPYIRAAWWHPGWIPFVSNDQGDYYCIDTDPPEPKRAGQVLLFFQEQPARPLVGPSLAAWLDRIIHDLYNGIYTYNEVEGFIGEAFLWSSLEGKHLLDGIEGKLIVKNDEG